MSKAEEIGKGKEVLNDILHAWPLIAFLFVAFGAIGSTIGGAWMDSRIEARHARQALVVPPEVQDLKLLVSSAGQTAASNSSAIARVEGKVDQLLLILTENGRQ